MSARFDLVIRNGTIVDGTGAAPREGDVAVSRGRIAAVGRFEGSGAEEIDAKGRIVTPGFVDIHTHYDGQAVWDSHMAPSSWHGVTTAVMGNCGVGFAPCKPADREKLDRADGGRRGHSRPGHARGPQLAVGVVPRVPRRARRQAARHRPLRAAAARRRPRLRDGRARHPPRERRPRPTSPQCASIAADAVRAGAFGFSTSRTISHKSLTGEYTPTLRANEEELAGIAMGLKDAGSGFIEIVSDWNEPDAKSEFAMLRRVVENSRAGRSCSRSAQRHEPERASVWKELLALRRRGDQGRPTRCGRCSRRVPIGILLGLEGSQNPFSGTPTYKSIASCRSPERVQGDAGPGGARQDPVRGPDRGRRRSR